MHKTLLAASATLAVLALALPASAASTVDFDELAHNRPYQTHGHAVSSGGLDFLYQGGSQFYTWGDHRNADPGGAALFVWGGGRVSVSKSDGGRFDLYSLDFADFEDTGVHQGTEVEFTFWDGLTTTTETIALDNVKGFQTATLNRENLVWFSMRSVPGRYYQFDNLTWSGPAASAVPEPAAWALMITGFAGAGAAIRRQRASARPVAA
jgi:PEP-CTERM putative exosortase interaction domain